MRAAASVRRRSAARKLGACFYLLLLLAVGSARVGGLLLLRESWVSTAIRAAGCPTESLKSMTFGETAVERFIGIVPPNGVVEIFGVKLAGVSAENGVKLLCTVAFTRPPPP
jgi:hypothetical protein